MTAQQETLFERFLAPFFRTFLIDEAAIGRYAASIDWETACDRLQNPAVIYPDYYLNHNFHGIRGGYLTASAAVTYDPITQYVLPPQETWVREGLVQAIEARPRRILDLGCGTGSTTLLLKQRFPSAEVIGLDLSPHMLVVATDKAQKAGLDIAFRHGDATATGLPAQSVDVVTASLLFHETPPAVTQAILREAYRLLVPGGEIVILDGNQAALRQTGWLTQIFEEPFIQDYAEGNLDAWLGAAGFGAVRTQAHWWLNQVSRGVKPSDRPDWEVAGASRYDSDFENGSLPAFGTLA